MILVAVLEETAAAVLMAHDKHLLLYFMILRGFHHGMDGLLEPEKDGWAIKLLVINLQYCTRDKTYYC